jgi:hypothetical protein
VDFGVRAEVWAGGGGPEDAKADHQAECGDAGQHGTAEFSLTEEQQIPLARAVMPAPEHVVDRFAAGGPTVCTNNPHSFFGTMTPEQWSILMYKHLDHHLRQFGV